MIGDRRPYLVALLTLDPAEAPAFAEQNGLAVEEVADSPEMLAEVQRTVDEVNARVGRVAQVKRFKLLSDDLTQDAGELTPTLKVKRHVVVERYAADVERLYAA